MKLKITWRNVLSKVGLHGRVHLGFVSTVLQYYQPADQQDYSRSITSK